jgi:protein-disulfide isomerase
MAIALLAQSAVPPGKAAPNSATAKPALDRAALEQYLRHVLMWPPSVEMTLGDPLPGPMPGYYVVKVHGVSGDRTQDEVFFVSADSQTIIHGDVFDIKKSPFQADINLIKTEGQPSLGPPDAPVTVVEFSDFQCPYCKQESSVVRTDLTQAYPKDVRVFYMDYPLDAIHPFARGAAILGRCIFHQNNASFWAYHDWIFSNQGDITPANLKDKVLEYAKGDRNLDTAVLSTCAVSPEVRTEVDRTKAIGDQLKISATPTLFINGRRMVGSVPVGNLKLVIDNEIAYAKTAKKNDDCCSVPLSFQGIGKGTPK